jgi:hypothetical protein
VGQAEDGWELGCGGHGVGVGEEADAVGAGGFERLDVCAGVVERADGAELGPPVRRRDHESLEAPRSVASDEVVEERHGVEAGVGVSRPSRRPATSSSSSGRRSDSYPSVVMSRIGDGSARLARGTQPTK